MEVNLQQISACTKGKLEALYHVIVLGNNELYSSLLNYMYLFSLMDFLFGCLCSSIYTSLPFLCFRMSQFYNQNSSSLLFYYCYFHISLSGALYIQFLFPFSNYFSLTSFDAFMLVQVADNLLHDTASNQETLIFCSQTLRSKVI